MRALIVGGGAVGLSLAEELASRGVETTILERDRCGSGASAGNAGWITPSLAIPVPGPGVISQSLRWLINPSGPFWIRPTLRGGMIGWLGRFLLHCSRASYLRGLDVLQEAAARAGPAFDQLAERVGGFELHADGLVYPAFERRELDQLLTVAQELREAGLAEPLVRLDVGELLQQEPGLSEQVVGGLHSEGERRVRPERFVSALRRAFVAAGGQIEEGETVTHLRRHSEGWLAQTSDGTRRGDVVVIANGAAARGLLADLDLSLPLVAAKGYSRTYPGEASAPRRALYLEAPKVAISVFEGAVRISGTLELATRNLKLSAHRLKACSAAAAAALPRWRMASDPSDWAGLRSLTPDGLPYIGAVPGLDGVYVATGHATLGITLAPLSAELLCDLILERRQRPLMDAFDPGRMLRRREVVQGLRHGARPPIRH